MQVVPSGGQIRNQCKWRHLVAKFATKVSSAMWWPNLELFASGAIWWPNLQLIQVVPPGDQTNARIVKDVIKVAPPSGQIFN